MAEIPFTLYLLTSASTGGGVSWAGTVTCIACSPQRRGPRGTCRDSTNTGVPHHHMQRGATE